MQLAFSKDDDLNAGLLLWDPQNPSYFTTAQVTALLSANKEGILQYDPQSHTLKYYNGTAVVTVTAA